MGAGCNHAAMKPALLLALLLAACCVSEAAKKPANVQVKPWWDIAAQELDAALRWDTLLSVQYDIPEAGGLNATLTVEACPSGQARAKACADARYRKATALATLLQVYASKKPAGLCNIEVKYGETVVPPQKRPVRKWRLFTMMQKAMMNNTYFVEAHHVEKSLFTPEFWILIYKAKIIQLATDNSDSWQGLINIIASDHFQAVFGFDPPIKDFIFESEMCPPDTGC